MLARRLIFVCVASLIPGSSLAEIKPEQTLLYENGRPTFSRLSFDGNWLWRSHIERQGRRNEKSNHFYNLPAAPSQPTAMISGGWTDSGWTGRWYVNQADRTYQVWDLYGDLNQPILKLTLADNKGAGYIASPRSNEAETCLVSVYRSDSGSHNLHLWYLNNPGLRQKGFHDLGEISQKANGRWPFLFTPNHGVLSSREESLVRWDLLKPSKPPVVFDLGEGGDANYWWQAGGFPQTPKNFPYIETPYMSWSIPEGKYFFTDFPMNPFSPGRWELPGTPVAFRGDNRVLVTNEKQYWICDFDGLSVSAPRKLASTEIEGKRTAQNGGWGTGTDSWAGFIGESDYVRVSNEEVILQAPIRVQTHIVSTLSPESNRIMIEDVENSRGEIDNQFQLRWNSAGRWLTGFNSETQLIWDLSQQQITDGQQIQGLEEDYLSHELVADRWLILFGAAGGLYSLDLASDSKPSAIKFFQIKSRPKNRVSISTSARRFCVEDPDAKCTYIWMVSQFGD